MKLAQSPAVILTGTWVSSAAYLRIISPLIFLCGVLVFLRVINGSDIILCLLSWAAGGRKKGQLAFRVTFSKEVLNKFFICEAPHHNIVGKLKYLFLRLSTCTDHRDHPCDCNSQKSCQWERMTTNLSCSLLSLSRFCKALTYQLRVGDRLRQGPGAPPNQCFSDFNTTK